MKRLIALAAELAALAPAVAAQTPASFTGKWEGTFTLQRPDGTQADPKPVVFNLTQKGKTLTGTAGPADKQWKIEKGAVTAGKANRFLALFAKRIYITWEQSKKYFPSHKTTPLVCPCRLPPHSPDDDPTGPICSWGRTNNDPRIFGRYGLYS